MSLLVFVFVFFLKFLFSFVDPGWFCSIASVWREIKLLLGPLIADTIERNFPTKKGVSLSSDNGVGFWTQSTGGSKQPGSLTFLPTSLPGHDVDYESKSNPSLLNCTRQVICQGSKKCINHAWEGPSNSAVVSACRMHCDAGGREARPGGVRPSPRHRKG